MKGFKKIISVVLCAVMLFGSTPLSGLVGLELPEWLYLDNLFAIDAKAETYSGSLNSNISWTFDMSTGELSVKGKGELCLDYSTGAYLYDYAPYVKSITIGSGITFVECYILGYCYNLESIYISDTVTSISCDFSYASSLSKITVSSQNKNYSNDKYGVLFNKNKTELIQYPVGKSSTSYVIPDKVKRIGSSAFEYSTNIKSIIIPDSVTYIGDYAFANCYRLENITIGEQVTTIGIGAFCECESLESVTILNGVSEISMDTFYYCTSLETITIPLSIKKIDSYAFDCCYNLKEVYYDGTEMQWNNITIASYNEALTDYATLHFGIIGDVDQQYVEFINDGKKGFTYLNFKQNWFENDSITYNHSLGQLCSQFVMLGYDKKVKSNDANAKHQYTKPNLEHALKTIGLTDIEIAGYTQQDEVNTFIAHREIIVNEEEYILIFAGFIGSQDGQWYNNFDPGTGAIHKGFASAKEYAFGLLSDYIEDHGFEKNKTKILVTGHSRGAATANLVAADLIKNETYAKKENVYTYAFATPNSTSLDERWNVEYDRIFNIVNPEDFVTKVLPNKWDYGRYGITYTLPSKTNTNSPIYNAYKNNMQQYFSDFTEGQIYEPYLLGEYETYHAVSSLTSSVKNINQFYNLPLLAGVIPMTPCNFFQTSLCHFVSNIASTTDYILAVSLAIDTLIIPTSSHAYRAIIDYFLLCSLSTEEVKLSGKFEDAHRAETYCAYMMSMTETQIKDKREGYLNTVNCPVDVEIIDNETGEVVGKIVNNVIDEEIAASENAVVMVVDNDSKSFWLPSDGNYKVILTGNDDGDMDYTVRNMDSDTGETKRANFFDVEIQNNVSIEGDIAGEDFVLEDYEPLDEENGVVEATEIIKEEDLQNLSVYITTEGVGDTTGDIIVTRGDYVTVAASTNEGNSFVGWYDETGVLISTEEKYSFVAKENICFIAKFSNNYAATWDIDGEITVTYFEEGKDIILPTNLSKTGYTFIGWTPEIPETMPDEDLSFTAIFEANSYDAVFDANGGAWLDGENIKTIPVKFDEEITAPETPQKQGYVFGGWDNEIGIMDSTDGKIFTSEWIPATDTQYTVEAYIMNTEGEYVKTIQKFTGETDSTVNAEYVIEEGFTLNDEMSVLSGTIAADNSLVLKVYIDRNVYIFTTIIDGVSTETMYFYDSVIAEPAIPSKTGYTFVDWDKTVPLMMPANDLTITAEFDANSYDALFNANGGKWSDGSTSKMVATDFDSEIVVPSNPIRQGFDFAGWDAEIGIMDDVNGKTFTAKWIARNYTKYTVETYTMGADGKYVVTSETKHGTTDTVAMAETEVVTGFALNEANSVIEGTIAGDGTLVLKVYIDRNTYTFTTVVDGVSTSKSYLYGSTVSEPVTPSKPGYKFIKWNGTIPQTMPAENITVTAVFEKSYLCPDCGKEILGEDAINKHIASETKVNIDGGNIVSGVVSPGATITVSAPQTNGKIFSHWEVTNATVADADSAETTVVIGSGKISITAVYDDCDCKCHQGGIAGFFFKITLFFQKLFGKNLECVCGAKH